MTATLHQQKQDHEHLRVLVVEDSDMLRVMFRKAFQVAHTIYAASGAKEGWRLYLDKTPDIVFVDIGLPDGNGHDLARMIKEKNPAAYIIMATASDYVEDKEKAGQNLADGFITKPYNKKEINDYIERCIDVRLRNSCRK
ncbi:MAG: response regulator [Alphaproteobacteria bacterium]|nr:response regulator [Alphaproteobacteria bacterium]